MAGRSASAPALGAAGPGLGSGPADGHHSPGLQLGLHPAGKPEPCTLRCARACVRCVHGWVKQDRFLHQDLGVVKPSWNHSVLFQSALICSQLSVCFLVFMSVTFVFVPFSVLLHRSAGIQLQLKCLRSSELQQLDDPGSG